MSKPNAEKFGRHLFNIEVPYNDQKLSYEVWGDARNKFAYLIDDISELQNLNPLPPAELEFWNIRGVERSLPVGREDITKPMFDIIKREHKKRNIAWSDHP